MSRRNSHRRIRRQDLQKALIVLSVVFFLIAIGGFTISRWENRKYATGGGESSVEVDPILKDDEKIIVDGKTYTHKKKVRSWLIMGADSEDEPVSRKSGGQADTQIVLVADDENETWQLLQIDRDTMVMMEVRDDEDNVIGTTRAQITIAHAYGRWETGAEYTAKVVSELLDGEKIYGYFSMNLAALPVLNDAVGGVPVKVTTDFTDVDPSLVLGEEITLTGDQAETFVRSRMSVDDGTNTARMARQREYLKGLSKKISALSEEEVADLYNQLMENSVTNMGSGDFVELAEICRTYTEKEMVEFEGEHTVSNNHVEFYIDEDSLQDVILQLYYDAE